MATHLGLCVKCAKTLKCAATNKGSMCLECFHEGLKDGKEDLWSLPQPGRKVFVACWRTDPLEMLSLDGTIYAFDHREDADFFLSDLRGQAETKLTGAQRRETLESLAPAAVVELEADFMSTYILLNRRFHPGLKMIGIAGRAEKGAK